MIVCKVSTGIRRSGSSDGYHARTLCKTGFISCRQFFHFSSYCATCHATGSLNEPTMIVENSTVYAANTLLRNYALRMEPRLNLTVVLAAGPAKNTWLTLTMQLTL